MVHRIGPQAFQALPGPQSWEKVEKDPAQLSTSPGTETSFGSVGERYESSPRAWGWLGMGRSQRCLLAWAWGLEWVLAWSLARGLA